ncbi:MAG: hypothetical protein EOM24_31610, partial [Chloroflexia bacterium]|nr:hypothetical protein [Chloroflexia bacterium]
MNNAFFDILIAPVGKQPMPLLLPILEYAPIATYLIPTHEVRDEAEAVRKVAKQARCRVIIIDDLVDPYRADETLARCREICTRPEVVRQRVAINLSGGTAVMALGAQHAPRELGLSMV